MVFLLYAFWGAPLGFSKKLVIFDVDGTLNMTEIYAVPAYKKVLREMGADGFTDEMLRDRIGAVFEDDIRYFFGSRAEEKKEEFERLIGEYWMKDVERKAKPFPHTEETLRELKEKGYSLAVCSNAENKEIDLVLRALHIKDYFSYIQGITRKEPNPTASAGCLKKQSRNGRLWWATGFMTKRRQEITGFRSLPVCTDMGKKGNFRKWIYP